MEVVMVKTPQGYLVPMNEDESSKARKWKSGSVIRGEFKEMRNGAFFRKFWALMDIAYDMWTDGIEPQTYQGQEVLPEKDRFRKDVCILAGYFRPVFDVTGKMKLEAESIAWANMDETRFEKLYSACIDAILAKVLSHKNISHKQLNEAVESVLRFA